MICFLFSRHNTYLYEATRHRDIGYQSTIHDLKLLLLRFAQDKSFSSESQKQQVQVVNGGLVTNVTVSCCLIQICIMPRKQKQSVQTLSILRCTWTGRINLKIFLGYDINYLGWLGFYLSEAHI